MLSGQAARANGNKPFWDGFAPFALFYGSQSVNLCQDSFALQHPAKTMPQPLRLAGGKRSVKFRDREIE